MKTNDPEVCEAHFLAVYDETYDDIKRFAAARCEDPEDLSDILQDTYLDYFRLIQKRGTDYASSPRAVLYEIAKRKIFRSYSLKKKLSVFVPLSSADRDEQENFPADAQAADTEEEALDRVEAERLWKKIGTYPPETRKILYLYFSCGMSHTEIAEATGLNVSNVKNRIYRTLSGIRKAEERKIQDD